MPLKIRFRTDNWFEPQPPAVPGDTWRIRWYREGGERGPVAGYGICCPRCQQVHHWTTSRNCSTQQPITGCSHVGVSSCWDWTGSAEDGTLTASPSLHCLTCGWHGWLKNGELTEC